MSSEGPISLREMKRNAACVALDFVEVGSVIGIGSGTTVWCFIDVLAESSIEIAGAVVRAERGVDLGWLRDVVRAVKAAT